METSRLGRVLIVDDQADIRLCLRYMLEADGYDVIGEAPDAPIGLQMARMLSPDLIVLDVLMSDLNGIEALPQFREAAPASKIVMHSTLQDSTYRRWALDSGADDYVDKSDLIRLPATLRRVLQKSAD